MSAKTDKFKLEYTKLTDSEKQELVRFIAEYQSANTFQKAILGETLSKSLGPTDSAKCGCCGK